MYCGVITTAGCLFFETQALQLVQSQDAALVYTTEPLWGAGFAYLAGAYTCPLFSST